MGFCSIVYYIVCGVWVMLYLFGELGILEDIIGIVGVFVGRSFCI